MKKFNVTFDFSVYKPQSYEVFKKREAQSWEVEADTLAEAKQVFKEQMNFNPTYFKFTEV